MASQPIIDDPIDDPVDPPVAVDPPVEPKDPPAQDWRERMAGGDEKMLGWLGRFQSETAAIQAAKKTRDDISAGRYIKPLSDDATDDEIAIYRGFFGVPETPEGYIEKLPDGLVVGDDDKPAVDQFITAMHGLNAPKPVVEAALKTYYDIVDAQAEEQLNLDAMTKEQGMETLREEWGPDYKRNLNVVKNHLETLPEPVKDIFEGARMPDGSLVANNPGVIQWLASVALEANPLSTVVPGAGQDQMAAIEDEIASLEKRMENRDAWFKDDKAQARYQELITARDKNRVL